MHKLITYFFILFSSIPLTVQSQNLQEWECLPGSSCEVPNKRIAKVRSYEISDSEKFEKKKEKFLAQEPKKFKAQGQKNNRELGLDKTRRGRFSAWAFPLNNFN